jgi:hypothetical protein
MQEENTTLKKTATSVNIDRIRLLNEADRLWVIELIKMLRGFERKCRELLEK